MNGVENQSISDELTIQFHFTDGEKYTQSLDIRDTDAAYDVIRWFRDKKQGPVWTWQLPHESRVRMVPRSQITFIEINGYIDLEGNDSRWYHRLIDRFRVSLKVGETLKKNKPSNKKSSNLTNMASKSMQNLKAAMMGRKRGKK